MNESFKKYQNQEISVNLESSLYGISAWGEPQDNQDSPSSTPINLYSLRKKFKKHPIPQAASPEKLPKVRNLNFPLSFSNNLNSSLHKTNKFKRKTFVQEKKNQSVCARDYKSPLYRMNSGIKPEKPNLFASPILYFLPKITISKAGLVKRNQ